MESIRHGSGAIGPGQKPFQECKLDSGGTTLPLLLFELLVQRVSELLQSLSAIQDYLYERSLAAVREVWMVLDGLMKAVYATVVRDLQWLFSPERAFSLVLVLAVLVLVAGWVLASNAQHDSSDGYAAKQDSRGREDLPMRQGSSRGG